MAIPLKDKLRNTPTADPSHGLKRDTRRDGRKRFGLKMTVQYKSASGNLGKAHSYTRWYESDKQRNEALRAEKAKGGHRHASINEIRTFESLER